MTMANEAKGLGRLLPPETITKLQKTREEMIEVKASLAMLKRMGMDISPIEEKMDWIDQMSTIMLEEYKKK